MVGFVFAHLLYYDNWQRLSFFYNSQSKLTDELVGEVTTRLQRKLVGVAFMLVVLYMCPVLLGAAQTLGGATQGSYGLLDAFLQDAYSSSPLWAIPVVLVFLFFVSALMSTADT